MPTIPSLEALMKAGVHFGHAKSKWHPKMAPFIYTHKNKIHIINLEKTVVMFNDALKHVSKLAAKKGTILFVSTNLSTLVDSPALSVANNSDGAIFFATQGALRIQNNAGAKSLAAYRLHVSQRATVNYVESDLADTKFSNSPGGVWHMIEDSWRQVK